MAQTNGDTPSLGERPSDYVYRAIKELEEAEQSLDMALDILQHNPELEYSEELQDIWEQVQGVRAWSEDTVEHLTLGEDEVYGPPELPF